MTGGPDEREANLEISAGLEGLIDLTGQTGLRVLAEFYRLMDVVVCPDTGPMHLAAAVDTPVVALFGPTAPWRTGPYGPRHTVVRTGIDCSPCFKKKCPNPECLTDIDEFVVHDAVTRHTKEVQGLKILHTEWSDGWGGQEIRILSDARAMIQKGCQATILAPPQSGLARNAREKGVPLIEFKIKNNFDLNSLWRLIRLFQKEKYDVVNTHSSVDSWVASLGRPDGPGPGSGQNQASVRARGDPSFKCRL